MKNIKTSELQDQQLVDKVAEAQGWTRVSIGDERDRYWWYNGNPMVPVVAYNPLTNDAQAMDILDKMEDVEIYGDIVSCYPDTGAVPLRIDMRNGTRRENLLRCFVASKLGDTVTVGGGVE